MLANIGLSRIAIESQFALAPTYPPRRTFMVWVGTTHAAVDKSRSVASQRPISKFNHCKNQEKSQK